MNQTEIKKFLIFLLKLSAAIVAVCLVILLLFRTGTLVSGIRVMAGILSPFLYGAAIAYVLHPLCRQIERGITWLFQKTMNRNPAGLIRFLAILLTLGLALTLIILLVILVIPQLVSSIRSIVSQLSAWAPQVQVWLNTMDQNGANHVAIQYINEIITTLTDKLQAYLETSLLPDLSTMISKVTSSFMGLFGVIKNFGLGCIVAAYLLGGWEKFIAQGKLAVYGFFPQKAADWIRDELHYIDMAFSGFIVGEILDSSIVGIVCYIFCRIASMPNALLISVIIGVTNLIPFFGPYLGAIPSAILILMVSPYKCMVFLIFVLVMQQIDGNIIAPRILGSQTGLSGFWILFAILLFSSWWGVIGMLIGVPVFAVIYDLFRRAVLFGLRKRNRTDLLEKYQKRFVRK